MAERSEAVSRTTFGGCTLDDLHRGSKNYVCDASCLVNLVGKDRNKAKEELRHKLDELFQDLELQTERRIKKYYIGKTFIKQRRRPNNRKKFVKFDPMDPYTWKKNGISSRWGCHKKMEYGRDGLVVLAAVTKNAVPQQCRQEVHQEQYALALEQMLLHYYKLDIGDQRLHNDTFTSGGPDGGKSIAYAVYVAFTLKEQTKEDDNENGSAYPKTCQPNEKQTTSDELSSYLVNQAQETSIHVPVIVNTSTSSVVNQPLKERSSLSDNDRFVIRPPQLEMDEVTDLQATNYILHRPSSVTFEQVIVKESTRDQQLLGEIDKTVYNNSLIRKSILSNKEQVPETVSHPSSLKLVTTSALTMLRQHNKEQSSSSDNDTSVIRPPQLDKMTSHQSTNYISSLQRTKPINEQRSLCKNNSLVIDSMNSHKLDLKKVAESQLHDCSTLQCPPFLQLKYLTMSQSVPNQLLLERISCHPIIKTKNVATSLNTTCVTNPTAIGSPKKFEHKETQLHTSLGER